MSDMQDAADGRRTSRDDQAPLLTKRDLARRWGVTERHVLREAKRWGLRPVMKAGRYRTPLYDPADAERVTRQRAASLASLDTTDGPETHDVPSGSRDVALVTRDPAPLVRQLADELVRPLVERLEATTRENTELRLRAEAAEAARLAAERERDALRARLVATQAAPADTGEPAVLVVEGDTHTHPPPLWRRLWRGLRGP